MPYSGMATPDPAVLRAAQDRFIAAWGQMATTWGISRTMAEVHALLYITGEPHNTDDVMERLQISRGNASMSLRALLEWGIIGRTHRRGDRKEYFIAEQDVWAMFRIIVRERMKREVDPLLASLYEIRDLTGPKTETRPAGQRMLSPRVLETPSAHDEEAGEADSPSDLSQSRIAPYSSMRASSLSDAYAEHNARLDAMLGFLTTLERLSHRFIAPSGQGLRLAATLLSNAS